VGKCPGVLVQWVRVPHTVITRVNNPIVIVIGIGAPRRAKLPIVVQALEGKRGGSGFGKGRQQGGAHDRNRREQHQQLDKGEG